MRNYLAQIRIEGLQECKDIETVQFSGVRI